jgi:hypothetical protein
MRHLALALASAACLLPSCSAEPEGGDHGHDGSESRHDGYDGRKANPADKPGGTGACDRAIARIFGDADMVAATSGYEPTLGATAAIMSGLDRSEAVGPLANNWGHLFGYAGHLYATAGGAISGNVRSALYIPPGFTKQTAPSGKDAVSLFYYPKLGTYSDVTLAVYHVADFNVVKTTKNASGSVRIGRIAGPGGDGPDYLHSHVEVHRGWGLPGLEGRNKTRIFFRDVFCAPDGTVPDPVEQEAEPTPSAWTCDTQYYDEIGKGHEPSAWCDCACGAPDPDCAMVSRVDGCADGDVCDGGVCAAP